jgi:hypothetical protein
MNETLENSLAGEADDHFHDECGVFGIFGRQDAAAIVTLGLHALQHRGQEAAGIVSFDGSQFHVERHVGLIGDTRAPSAIRATRPPVARVCAMCSRSSPNLPTAASRWRITATSPTQ